VGVPPAACNVGDSRQEDHQKSYSRTIHDGQVSTRLEGFPAELVVDVDQQDIGAAHGDPEHDGVHGSQYYEGRDYCECPWDTES
jgi:hypothetical protein